MVASAFESRFKCPRSTARMASPGLGTPESFNEALLLSLLLFFFAMLLLFCSRSRTEEEEDAWRNAQVFYPKFKYMLFFFFARDDDDDDGQYMILPFRLVNSLSLSLGSFFDSFFFLLAVCLYNIITQ